MDEASEIFTCFDCGKEYVSHSSLYRHMKYYCNKDPLYQCNGCRRKFYQKVNFKKHLIGCKLLNY